MRAFANVNPTDLGQAVALLSRARAAGQAVAVAGGGSDLLGMIKDQLVAPDLLVDLKSVGGLDRIEESPDGLHIGALATLEAIAEHPLVRQRYAALAEAASQVGTPQIRYVGTLGGNVCQRPWCWYYRNGFPCLKRGGHTCFAAMGENQHHALFGGGPSYIVHPSDTAPALLALGARFRIVGPRGPRVVPAATFFVLPSVDVRRENVLQPDELLAEVLLPRAAPQTRGTYVKVMDREAWTHMVVSLAAVLELEGDVCRKASVVLGGVAPIPWRLPHVDRMLAGQRLTPELAERAGQAAVAGAVPLRKNGYKVPMTRALVRRTLLGLVARETSMAGGASHGPA